jgi:hypothetical protein
MRKWGLILTAFYALIILALLVPLVTLVRSSFPLTTDELKQAYGGWITWTFTGVLLLSQALLLWLSVDTTRRRLKPRTHILITAIITGFLVTVLVLAVVVALAAAAWGDNPPEPFYIALIVVVSSWLLWAILFYRLWRNSGDPITRAVAWLFRGSVLELLVAVPSHVIVRRRHDCCAPTATALGIATGIAIMLLSFGPSVLLLYKKRMEKYSTGPIAPK